MPRPRWPWLGLSLVAVAACGAGEIRSAGGDGSAPDGSPAGVAADGSAAVAPDGASPPGNAPDTTDGSRGADGALAADGASTADGALTADATPAPDGAPAADAAPPGGAPPPPAAAAGYTRLAFYEEFLSTDGIDMNDTGQPGFNFYRRLPFGYPTLPTGNFSVADSVLTISSQTGPNMGLVSIGSNGGGGWHGFAATNGAYFEARVAFDPMVSAGGWPSFWTMAAEHLYGNATEIIEVDFFEYDTRQYDGDIWGYGGAIHDWRSSGGPFYDAKNNLDNFVIRVPHTVDWSSFATVGTLWLPGVGIDFYFDDAVTTDRNPYSQYPEFQFADDQHWPVIIGSDGWPLRIDWVKVWMLP